MSVIILCVCDNVCLANAFSKLNLVSMLILISLSSLLRIRGLPSIIPSITKSILYSRAHCCHRVPLLKSLKFLLLNMPEKHLKQWFLTRGPRAKNSPRCLHKWAARPWPCGPKMCRALARGPIMASLEMSFVYGPPGLELDFS